MLSLGMRQLLSCCQNSCFPCHHCLPASSIVPSMYMRVISVFPFVLRVIVFLKCPGYLPLPLYVTLIVPLSPGAMGLLVYCGTVHPQLAMAWFMTRGALPILVNVNMHFCTGVLSEKVPRLHVSLSNLISACADALQSVIVSIIAMNKIFFIFTFCLL